MFDAALIDALDRVSSPPAIIRSLADMSDGVSSTAKFAKRQSAQLDRAEASLSEWMEEGRAVRASLSVILEQALSEGLDPMTFLPKLDERIALIELAAVRAAQESDELALSLRRQARVAKKLGGEVASVFADIAGRTIRIMERELEDRGDFVLFLKAWRARFDQTPKQPSFEDPKKLEGHLKAILAA